MHEITLLFLNNFTTLCLAVGLLIIIISNKNLGKKTTGSFILFVLIVLVLVAADTTDYYLTSFTQPYLLRYITSAVGYTLRPASLAVIIGILLRRNRSGIVLWLPVIFVAAVSFTSYFTHIMFWFSDHNYFVRGPLGYISHIISGVYMAVLVVLTIKMHRHITSGEIFNVIYIAVICVLATVLESKLNGYKFLLNGAMASSCALYYIVLTMETFKRDILTGLMNRYSFYQDAKRMRNKQLAVISIDLNGLKDINDSQGHSAGDRALQDMGKAMLVKSGKKFYSYRVGGDEFMALGKAQNAQGVNTYIDDMRAALQERGLTASFGFAFYDSGDSFDNICNQADACMYRDKNKYKHRGETRE